MKYKIIKKTAFNVAGIRKTTDYAGGVWGIVKSDGSIAKMEEIAGQGKVTLGLCFGFDEEGRNDNMVGFLSENAVENYSFYQFPASDWMEMIVEGKISDNVLWETWQYIHKKLIDKKVIIQREVPTIEDYVEWNEDNDYCKIIIYVAVM